jgi:hypothetical protein
MSHFKRDVALRAIYREVKEVLSATRMHEREVERWQTDGRFKRSDEGEDVIEGLAISATKLEHVLKGIEAVIEGS